jgi:hypothetical protein
MYQLKKQTWGWAYLFVLNIKNVMELVYENRSSSKVLMSLKADIVVNFTLDDFEFGLQVFGNLLQLIVVC